MMSRVMLIDNITNTRHRKNTTTTTKTVYVLQCWVIKLYLYHPNLFTLREIEKCKLPAYNGELIRFEITKVCTTTTIFSRKNGSC